MTTQSEIDSTPDVDAVVIRRDRLRGTLLSIIAAAVISACVAVGFAWGHHTAPSDHVPKVGSVDVGFVQDMIVHHSQAVTMAGYARDYTTDAALKLLAYDIEGQQTYQIGQMQGWLDTWGAPTDNSSPMSWMQGHGHLAANGLMPGMATPAEVNHLRTLHGKQLTITFLQLMIRHHQGGIPMAQYAAQHATETYVRQLAQAIVSAQSSEIIAMEQTLRQLGASPLPPPES